MAHIPVLLQECLSVLSPSSGEFFVDGTLGGGGHALEIMERLQPGGTFVGIDKDQGAISSFEELITGRYFALDRILLENKSYSELDQIIQSESLSKPDGLLLDLGFSSEQIRGGKLAGRGFSFLADEPLLMTYDLAETPLKDILPTLSESELEQILREYGEERYSPQIAKEICSRAKEGKIQTSLDLVSAVKSASPKDYDHGRINPATRTFQALRIYINQELTQLEDLLKKLPNLINKNGRVAVISFHSLEDRIVKKIFKHYATEDIATLVTKKPITATSEEVSQNPRSRSAKLRALKFK